MADAMAASRTDTVWDLLTDYDNLAEVVPNLLSNEARRSAERANTRVTGAENRPAIINHRRGTRARHLAIHDDAGCTLFLCARVHCGPAVGGDHARLARCADVSWTLHAP